MRHLVIASLLLSGLVLSKEEVLVKIDDTTFKSEVESHKGHVLLNVSAVWCLPCQSIAGAIEALDKDFDGSPKVIKMDFDASPATMQKLGIQQLPSVVLFKDGAELGRFTGTKVQQEIKDWVLELISGKPVQQEQSKERVIHPVTGLPIYNEDEPVPAGIKYHIRSKKGELRETIPATAPVVTKRSKKDIEEALGFLKYDLDGVPIFKEDSAPPPGIAFRYERNAMTSSPGFT